MRVRRLEVQRFRGIRSLDWRNIGQTVALVGPGDSGKSSVLDALERVLSPRWNLAFDDTDFWNVDPSEPLIVRCTVTGFPKDLLKDSKFGLAMQALDEETCTAGPPTGQDAEIHALVIELKVEASLEPTWNVVDAVGHLHAIGARDRESLGMLRLGAYLDVHLGWSRGSVLTKLTATGDAVGAVLAEAARQARNGLNIGGLERLMVAAASVETIGAKMGVASRTGLAPRLDAGALSLASGALALHDGAVPVRRSGTGSRRLLTVAMQKKAASECQLTLIDEFEHGLEPHRIRKLLRVLRGVPPEAKVVDLGQLFLTTHSPTVLSELRSSEVFVTRRTDDGVVEIDSLPQSVGYVLPRVPEALLARKVVVGEGATEEGLCLALDEAWEAAGAPSFAYLGVAVVDGAGGTQPAEVAGALARLGYVVALLVDSDATAKVSKAAGALVLAWHGGVSTEERLLFDLPLEAVRRVTGLAVGSPKARGARAVRDAISDALKVPRGTLGDQPAEWVDLVDEAAFRQVLGLQAKKHGWFKTRELGHALGSLVAEYLDALAGTPSGDILTRLKKFTHDG